MTPCSKSGSKKVGYPHLRDSHEPAGYGAVDERGLRPPAEGVGVLDGAGGHQAAGRLQVLYDVLIRVLDILPCRNDKLCNDTYTPKRFH